MHIQFFGAARTVTGSCYIIETGNIRFAVDYGMYQGSNIIEERNRDTALYNAENLDFILLTHAHIDHSGLLPRAVKDGFTGPIFCTAPTAALLNAMLQDSAHIQEMDAEWTSRKLARQGKPPVEPLYTMEDAKKTLTQLHTVEFGQKKIYEDSNIRFAFQIAGHILGAAFIELEIEEEGKVRSLVFSGDLGRTGALLMNQPVKPEIKKPDYLFLESTYGDRNHKSSESSIAELVDAIDYSYSRGEKVIIPAFAVERTQELLFILRGLHLKGKIPADMPVFVDSPLAIKATEVFRQSYKFFSKEVTDIVLEGGDPFSFPNLHFTPTTEQSQAINAMEGPAIILSASGMCNAGRIRHHLRHNIWRKGASVVFTGYQSIGTPGRKIVDGAKSLSLLGEELAVEARIYTIGGFSAHAGQEELVTWAESFAHKDMTVFFVHGEEKALTALSELVQAKTGITSIIPDYMEVSELNASGMALAEYSQAQPLPAIDWEEKMYSLRVSVEGFEKQIATIASKPLGEQYELLENLANVNAMVHKLLRDT